MDGASLHFTMHTSHPVGSDFEPKGQRKTMLMLKNSVQIMDRNPLERAAGSVALG